MIAVRLTADQRDQVRRDIADRGRFWNEDRLAFRFADDRAKGRGRGDDLENAYMKAIRSYYARLVKNYKTVRAQARPA